jgi:tetratricopeptide (TPR) repeat protein
MAYAATGKLDGAENERNIMVSAANAFPADKMYGFNTARNILGVAENILSARIAMAKNDKKATIEFLNKALKIEGSLNYDEPEDWYIPVRELLGGALLRNGEYVEAERVFRAELEKHRRNGRALFGLAESLRAQGKQHAAEFIQREFEESWKNSDTKLRVEDL